MFLSDLNSIRNCDYLLRTNTGLENNQKYWKNCQSLFKAFVLIKALNYRISDGNSCTKTIFEGASHYVKLIGYKIWPFSNYKATFTTQLLLSRQFSKYFSILHMCEDLSLLKIVSVNSSCGSKKKFFSPCLNRAIPHRIQGGRKNLHLTCNPWK